MHTLLTYTYVKCWGFLIVFCEAEETRTLGRQEQDRNVAIELLLVFSIKFPRGKNKTLATNSTMWVSKFGGRKRKSNNVCRNNTLQKEARKIGCHVFVMRFLGCPSLGRHLVMTMSKQQDSGSRKLAIQTQKSKVQEIKGSRRL